MMMTKLDISVMVVDDAKFSSSIIAKTLSVSGYSDVRIAQSAHEAIEQLDQRKANILITDWWMPEMDGLQLAKFVRQMDRPAHHHTYMMLITARELESSIDEAFEAGIDDFIIKSDISKQLIPRMRAAERMSEQMNTLLSANKLLSENNQYLKKSSTFDPDTGVGNNLCAQIELERLLWHVESREGAFSYLLLNLNGEQEIIGHYSTLAWKEMCVAVSQRLTDVMRPLDLLCRINTNQFVLIAQFGDSLEAHKEYCERILRSVNGKSFLTREGYVPCGATMSACVISGKQVRANANDLKPAMPSVRDIEQAAKTQLSQKSKDGDISVSRWNAEKAIA